MRLANGIQSHELGLGLGLSLGDTQQSNWAEISDGSSPGVSFYGGVLMGMRWDECIEKQSRQRI